jgi:hypothetical protein
VFDNPARHVAAVDSRHDKIRGQAKACADGLIRVTKLMARMLVERRMDSARDTPG